MNVLSDLFDVAQVRDVLAVSEADLPMDTLNGFGLEDEIADALDTACPNWETLEQVRHIRKLRLYCKYKAASIVAVMAPVFILKKMSDGANEGQRSDKDGFRWLADELAGKANKIMDDLLDELGENTAAPAINLSGTVKPDRDPITEPRDVSS